MRCPPITLALILVSALFCSSCKRSKEAQVPDLEVEHAETKVMQKALGDGRLSLVLPVSAVMVRGKKTWVVVHGSDAKEPFAPVQVVLGASASGYVVISKGLKLGDRVLVEGALGYLYNDLPKDDD